MAPVSASAAHSVLDCLQDANAAACLCLNSSRLFADQSTRQKHALAKIASARRFAELDREPCQVLQGLFIGSIGAAKSRATLKRLGISHIVNASPVVPCFHRNAFKYKVITVYDDADEDIQQHFQETNRFITEARKAGGALVHCYAGRSRSATLILAYLLACEGLSFADAFTLLLAARPCASPNAGFLQQLHDFSTCFAPQTH